MKRIVRSIVLAAFGGSLLASPTLGQCEPTEVAKALASDGQSPDSFGYSVSVSGDTAVFGAQGDDGSRGSVYVFKYVGGEWLQSAKLRASDGRGDDRFGYSVCLHDRTLVVGARKDDSRPAPGAAYVFEATANGWTEVAKLTASDGFNWDGFGWSVSVVGDTIVCGASTDFKSGSAYVFEKVDGTWNEVAKLVAPDGGNHAQFGHSVRLDGSAVLVGAPFATTGAVASGAAYIFEKLNGAWVQTAKLTASDGAERDVFGWSVALLGDTAVCGAPGATYSSPPGSVYIFEQVGGVWAEVAQLSADSSEYDGFGGSVAMSDAAAIAGTWNGEFVYLLERLGGVWTRTAKLLPSDGWDWRSFGGAVAVDNHTALCGAPNESSSRGSAYIFDLGCACPADFNGDGAVDSRDFIAFLNAWVAEQGSADFDGNGAIDSRDVIAYLNAWTAGC